MEPKSECPLFNFELVTDSIQNFLTYRLHLLEDAGIFDVKCVFNMRFGDD